MNKLTSGTIIPGRNTVQWSYLLSSSTIILVLMVIVGFLNIRHLQDNYKQSFFQSSEAVAKGGIQTMEYGLAYGKTMANFYTAQPIINEIHEYISSSENVSIVGPDGTVYFTVFPKKSLQQTDYKAMLVQVDALPSSKSGAQTILRDGIHHEFIPVRGVDGTAKAFLEVTFEDDVLKSKTLGFTQTSILTVLIVTILGTVLFMVTVARVRTTNERGEVRRNVLMTIMIVNITVCQLLFSGINLWTFRSVLEANAVESTRYVGKIVKRNIDNVINKGVHYDELNEVQSWMTSVVSSSGDIKGAVIAVNDGKVNYSSAAGLSTDVGSDLASQIVLPLNVDSAKNQATLTMVVDRDNLRRKLWPTLLQSAYILLGSIAALVQLTFVSTFLLNRRAISNLKHDNELLEKIIEERTQEIRIERDKSEKLLLNVLPQKVADELKSQGFSEPEGFSNVSVFFSDVVNFTTLSTGLEPKFLIKELSDIFTNFDKIAERYHCQRIKTIGDAYLCVAGMPVPDPRHAQNLVNAALEMLDYLNIRNETTKIQWRIRVGIHTGSVVGGIVGTQKYLYDVFGDTVNTASRMESNSEPMRVNISNATWELVKDDFITTDRGEHAVKGKDAMHMYFVDGRLPATID
nr:adenylate/guanylate cyclase domain-containing protein [Rhodoferax sp.]